mgnify:CR=1 FL=1
MTDSVQPPVVETNEKSTQTDRAPHPQTLQASTQTVPQPVVATNEKSTQTDRAPCPRTVQASTQTEPPSRNYEEELKEQVAITEEAKKRHNEAIAQLGEQAAGREADLKRLLDESSAKLQAKEREVLDLQVANTEVKERLSTEEERNSRRELQQFEENEELRSQNRELQTMAHQHLHMWKISEEQRATLSDSYNHLQVEALVDIERQRDILMKESDERAAQLSRSYKRELEIIKAKVASLQSTCEHIVHQRQQEA